MNEGKEYIDAEFYNKANPIFLNALNEFEHAARGLNRHAEEYRFVELKERHIQSLKQQLEGAATRLVQQHQHHRQLHELQQSFQQIIKDYLHRFVIKSRTI
jgi:hypothetical protein